MSITFVFMRQLLPTLLHVCIFLLASCKPGDGLQDPEVVVTVDPEFTVDLFEERDAASGNKRLGLWIESMKYYPCATPQINASVSVAGNNISVRILGVSNDTCQGLPQKARMFLPFGAVSTGIYAFSLSLGPVDAIQNKGELKVEADEYALSLPNAQGVDVQHFELKSIPDPMLWGQIQTPGAQAGAKAAQCIADLKSVSDDPLLEPGYYGYFTLSATGQWNVHSSLSSGKPELFFVRRATQGFDAIKTILGQYRSGADSPLMIRCLTSNGAL